ncbi:hypothetical protein A2801_03505 [Candidatus Woesebacteria bacterium RIFCSPHIGHO2_01_FULL_41_10]|uniref:DUF2130 domain-containing protein n=1 Tax=Candidatus Woesebacteria bacterium RIFCSPHIGHO2_01_FULL_41_10 TaxID=1802500 RepID=A0A1F7YN33_9BACT|nr:MAG: hypothetical protein A2801_03505 [Candidatus Woesebacteria bacterium RIFCSPHIGHO2_01_FULL_41_10]
MADTIKCPHCGKSVEVTEALTHQIQEQIVKSLETQHAGELVEAKRVGEENAHKILEKKFSQELDALKREKDEERDRSKSLSKQVTELLDEIRQLRRKDEERDIQMKKKLLDEEAKIREEATKRAQEEHRMKDLEKDKKLQDAIKQVDELRSRIEQGSQQTQGESLELELEKNIKAEFPADTVSEVKKGQRGADIIQEVVDKNGKTCGVILWESKNAKWSDTWITKLKDDKRQANADLAVLVSVHLPGETESFIYRDGVWIVGVAHYLSLALALRFNLVSMYHERQNAQGKDEKMRIMYEYLTGKEFRHRVEAIVEAFGTMQEEMEREKRWFHTKWARQEKTIRNVIDNTHGMYGDLQGVIGRQVLPIKGLELLDDGTEEN